MICTFQHGIPGIIYGIVFEVFKQFIYFRIYWAMYPGFTILSKDRLFIHSQIDSLYKIKQFLQHKRCYLFQRLKDTGDYSAHFI